MKILHVTGARPQFIKAAPVGKALRTAGHTEVLGFNYHQYTIRVEQGDALAAYLKERGIGTMVYYPVPFALSRALRRSGLRRGEPSGERGC